MTKTTEKKWCFASVPLPGHKCALPAGHDGPHNVYTAGEPTPPATERPNVGRVEVVLTGGPVPVSDDEREAHAAWPTLGAPPERPRMTEAATGFRRAENIGVPPCAVCGGRATCIGAYESSDAPLAPACDKCCGHGNEDGRCFGIDDDTIATLIEAANAAQKEARETDADLSAAREREARLLEEIAGLRAEIERRKQDG